LRLRRCAALTSIIALGACHTPPSTTTDTRLEPTTVETIAVLREPVNVTLQMPGELDPYEQVAIYSKVTGFVKDVRVDRGSRVRRGQPLAQIDAPELVAQRAESQSKMQAAGAQLAAARAKADADASTYDRLKAASAMPGVVAGNDLQVAQKTAEADQSQVSAAEQNVDAARQALQSVSDLESYLTIKAPFDGVVTERNVHPGALVGPNAGGGAAMPMLRVVGNSRLRLVVAVPQAYVAGVARGTHVTFTVPAYPGQTFDGTIERIADDIDPQTRTMAVELDVMNAGGRLASGAFCQVQWPVRRPTPSLFVPATAVATTTDRTFVVRIRNGKTEWVDVETGLASGPLVEVFGNLNQGDLVAAHGTDEIKPGTAVQVRGTKSSL